MNLGYWCQSPAPSPCVGDRALTDRRYNSSTDKLEALGWVEETPWEGGLKKTVEWYKQFSGRYGNIDSALVAHPRQGLKKA